MSAFRDTWLPNLVSGLLYFLLGLMVIEQAPRPWVRNLARPFTAGRAAFARLSQRLVLLTRHPMDLTPEALPPRTASATATALLPLAGGLSPVPQFVNTNNSGWMLEEHARQRRIAARIAMM